ncbi:transglutaminase-like domain-containing protein [Desertivirga xinjiangensis]|uniref:transglutaminase-like domain-containing protein n=1 Tax=Desertivirga xinjiangensis TaxID=539206 RepID=UPI00210E3B27|nr:transglutaminase family protein [Pedobacter xinjiangensis]
MKFNVLSELEYDVDLGGTLILNIHALRTAGQTILEESLSVEPYVKVEELFPADGESRLVRLETSEKTKLKIKYQALVDTSCRLIDAALLDDVPVAQMPAAILPFLYPSRYCQSDKLYRLANNKFGHFEHAFDKVIALTDWIYRNVEYLSGSTNAQTSAYDTVTEQAGVCRDFAHLGIALCRALTIPARYFTGYSYQLSPADFHACFEAYLGGQWIIFDPTRLAPLNGMVKIASGRDAADAAIANFFGNISCGSIKVDCQLAEGNFEPVHYSGEYIYGIAY